MVIFNPLPHEIRPPEEGDIRREKTILMTSLQVWKGLHQWVEYFTAPINPP